MLKWRRLEILDMTHSKGNTNPSLFSALLAVLLES